LGDRSFVSLQSEIIALKTEHDDLVAENAVLKTQVETLREKNDALKDQIIDVLLKKSID
jgi:cell division protein FtsB